jgi:acyl carrier protein
MNTHKKHSGKKAAPMPANPNDTFFILQHIIAETTGIELEEITLDADLEEDLGVNMMSEFPVIITKIQKQIEVNLPVSSVKECATIADLVELVDDEREL